MANEPPFISPVSIGDLCRATIHDDPAAVAAAMARWFDDPDAVSFALTWLTELTAALDEYARHD